MQEAQLDDIYSQSNELESRFDLKVEFFKILSHWKIFAIFVFVAFITSFLYLRYTTPIYEVSCSVLIKNDTKNRMASTNIISELDAFKQQSNLQNEIGIIHSKTLSKKTVKDFGLYVSYFYYTNKLSRKIELFDDCPFKVHIDTTHLQLLNIPIKLNYLSDSIVNINIDEYANAVAYDFSKNKTDNSFSISTNSLKKDLKLNDKYSSPSFAFTISSNPDFNGVIDSSKDYYFIIYNPETIGEAFASSIETDQIDEGASIIEITQKTTLPSKSIEFLNALTETYINLDLELKNLTASKTIDFIDEQLGLITDSLHYVENILENFRTKNKTLDLSTEYEAILTKLEEEDKEKVKVNIEIKYYDYILDYLNSKNEYNDIVGPSFVGITDETLSTLVTELITLSTEKNKLSISSTENNPYYTSIESSIVSTKKALKEQITNSLNLANISLKDINKRIAESEATINKLPGTERDLLTIQRKFDVNDDTYSFLLEKKAEASISKASNLSNHRIIDAAELVGKVYPQSTKIYLIALILGLILPYIFIRIREYLNDTIQDRKEIETHSNLPIIGIIAHSSYDTSLIVIEKPRSMVSETIRSVKASMDFISPKEHNIITITSTVGGEGKTLCSINLSCSYALSGLKTVLIGADLRRPRIYKDFNLTNHNGLSSYLIGKSKLNEIISETQIENLHIITAGQIPPNPAELLGSEKMKELLDELRKSYNCIIIDTPPLGIVTDALFMMKHSDINVYVTRFNYSNKKVIKDVNDMVKTTGIKNVCFILNDVPFKKNKYGKYSRYSNKYGYAYSYSEGYYED